MSAYCGCAPFLWANSGTFQTKSLLFKKEKESKPRKGVFVWFLALLYLTPSAHSLLSCLKGLQTSLTADAQQLKTNLPQME